MAGVLMRRVAGQSRRLHAAPPASVASLGKPATFTPLIKPGKKPFVCMTGEPYLSEARAGPRRQPPKLEALFAVPDRFWARQGALRPPVWPVFLSDALKELYGPLLRPPVEML